MRTRAEQIAAIKADQQFWRDLVAEVGPDRHAEPGPMGEWSFGDVAGHLLGWRNRTINRLDAFAKGQPDPPDPWPPFLAGDPSDDPVNAWIHAQHADTPPGQLVADYDASYDRLIDVLGEVPDARLTDPMRSHGSKARRSSMSISAATSTTSTSRAFAGGSTEPQRVASKRLAPG
jgi:mycothiol maleylpyruvate isomerase-like protein